MTIHDGTLNTVSRVQRIDEKDYRGSYTQIRSDKQYAKINELIAETKYEHHQIWWMFFAEDIKENWEQISVNAASEIIQFLMRELNVLAFIRKVSRTEQEQHDYEMGIDRSLDSYGR